MAALRSPLPDPRHKKAKLIGILWVPFYLPLDMRWGDEQNPRPQGAVAQLGERLVRNEEVSGSIPLGSTKEFKGVGRLFGQPLILSPAFVGR